MKAIKQYGWVLQIIGAALLIGLAIFLELSDSGGDIVVIFIGSLIILSSGIRLVPYVKSQKSDLVKTINIIEITVDVLLGIALITIQLAIEKDMGSIFGILIGIYLIGRGSVHFFGVSEKKEKSDLPLYFFHIAAIIVGTIVFMWEAFDVVLLIHIILFFSVVTGGYFIYGGYKGYRSYRYQKQLYMPESVNTEEKVEKKIPVTPGVTPEKDIEEQDQIQDQVS